MNWIRQNWTTFSILVLVFSAGWIAFSPPSPGSTTTGGKIPAPREGFLAPDFTAKNRQGESIQLRDLRGQPVLLNVWASWCGPCKAEMPAMQEVYEAYSNQGFTILAVNTTFQDDAASALAFADNLGLTFPILFDVDGDISQKYQVRAMPTSFFIDQDGIIQRVVFGGPMSEALLRVEIERLIQEER
jgi:cytochrome c biogenesis protein CcmG, thiol:disulfide interchange protein DsbE